MRISAIVLAAGEGRRFHSKNEKRSCWNKVFRLLAGKPILSYSLETLSSFREIKEILLVVPRRYVSAVRREFLRRYPCRKITRVVAGGRERSDSSYAGLRRVRASSSHVLIHDAARPLISVSVINRLLASLSGWDGAVLAKPVTPTIKRVRRNRCIETTISRKDMWEAETPQIFRRSVITRAFRRYRRERYPVSDDAALCENIGARIRVVENQMLNIKITTVADFDLAERCVSFGSEYRWGVGYDIHRLVPRRVLKLGGISLPGKLGSLGHSDGDAITHAIIDALLGAAGFGDIGDWFPDTDCRMRGISSERLLRKVLARLAEAGYEPFNVDATVHLERPKLGRHKMRIRKNLARLLSIDVSKVNIKAKTSEGLGEVGQGKAVAAEAIACLRRGELPRSHKGGRDDSKGIAPVGRGLFDRGFRGRMFGRPRRGLLCCG